MTTHTVLKSLVKVDGSRSEAKDAMHLHSSQEDTPFLSMLTKDNVSHQRVMNEYLDHWEEGEDTEKARSNRETKYASMVNK